MDPTIRGQTSERCTSSAATPNPDLFCHAVGSGIYLSSAPDPNTKYSSRSFSSSGKLFTSIAGSGAERTFCKLSSSFASEIFLKRRRFLAMVIFGDSIADEENLHANFKFLIVCLLKAEESIIMIDEYLERLGYFTRVVAVSNNSWQLAGALSSNNDLMLVSRIFII